MISKVFVDGVQVNSDKIFLTAVNDGSAANIDLNTYIRGGRSGVVLGAPFYRGFVLSLEFSVIGDDYSDLVTQRDLFASYFSVKDDKTATQTRTLGFEMANGVVKQIDVIFAPFSGSISASDTTKTTFQVIAKSESEYFVSSSDNSDDIFLYDGGGMAIAMGIPMDMSVSPQEQAVLIQNYGNAGYYPTIKLYATLDGFDLYNETTGKTLSGVTELTSSDYVDLDFYNRTAIKNGTTNILGDISGTWWWLAPGYNSIKLTTTTGAGYGVITYRSAYRGI